MENGNERLKPFLKWAGGKTQLLPELLPRCPESFGTYYEPFLGAGSMLLALRPERAVVADANPRLVGLWEAVRDDVDGLVDAVRDLDSRETDRERYEIIRSAFNAGIGTRTQLAAAFVWLNKHCFNGLYRENAKGGFNVPWNGRRTGPSLDEENARAVSRYLNGADVEILLADFADAMAAAVPGDFVYLDPPYVPAGTTAGFTAYVGSGFAESEHLRVAQAFASLSKKGVAAMASNNDTPYARGLYAASAAIMEPVDARRSISSRAGTRTGRELVIRNYLD